MTTREPQSAEEARLMAELAALAPSPEAAESVLLGLASALFPGGVGGVDRVTWPEPPGEPDGASSGDPAAERRHPEARLREAEARYRTLVEQIPAVTFMAVLGEGKNEVYVSPHIESLLGFTQAEWLEDPFLWYRQLHPDDRAVWIEEFARGVQTGGPFRAECRFLTRAGDVVWVRGEARLVKDERGRPLFLQGVAYDITESKRAQEILVAQAVRITEERYRQVVEGAGAIFWEANPATLEFTFVSQQAERVLGFPRARWLGDPQFWLTLVHPDDRGTVRDVWQAVVRDGAEREVEYRAATAAGAVVWLHSRLRTMPDGAGRRHLLGFTVDVTERRSAEDERARLLAREQEARAEAETLIRVGRQLAAELELQPLVQAVTDAGRELTGAAFAAFFYNLVDERGESYTLYTVSGVPREVFERFPLPRNTALFAPTFRGEGIVRIDDVAADPRYGRSAPHHGMPPGHLPVRSYLAVPVVSRGGEVLGGLFFGHPEPGRFTERHERMLGGLASQAAIAMDNARLFQAADEARKAAEASNRAKDEFLATLSHELRTPLTAVLGWARILRAAHSDAATVTRAVEIIERNASAQAQLIEDLLDVSRIILGKFQLDLRPIESLQPLIETVVESFRPAVQAKRLQLDVEVHALSAPIAGDPDRLQQVVWNLVSNAIKFTPAGGRVSVSSRARDDEIEIRISDTGKGIPPAFLPHLFDRFTQADSTTTRVHGGLGLGLSIVRHLVELHGGTVTAESAGEGRGATFVVRLPIADPGADTDVASVTRVARRPRGPRRTMGGVEILVIEDDEDTRTLMTTILDRAGATVEAVGTAAAALAALERRAFDVLVCDIGLPGQDGYDVLRTVRAGAHGRRITALAVTAYASVEDRRRALAAGFDGHLSKPIDPDGLVAAVDEARRRAPARTGGRASG